MSQLEQKEIRVLVPKQIMEKAKALAENGLYEEALTLLERNKMVFEIFGTFMKMRMPLPEVKARNYHFKKR